MKCYLCDKEAVSDEHSPAECFFPVGMKINLIKVPSCNDHNEKTSSDDEYVRNLIVATKGNNNIATLHFSNKVVRSFRRNPKLINTTFPNLQYLKSKEDNEGKEFLATSVDRIRFERVMRKTAYGLYYNKFKERWLHELAIATPTLFTENGETDELASLLEVNRNREVEIVFEGHNPEIFKYSFWTFSFSPHKILLMIFYDCFQVYAVPRITTEIPFME